MGDANQLSFLQHYIPSVDGAVLEVGSKQYGSTSSFRDYYRGVDYVGADMEAGEGVDVVHDFVDGGYEFMNAKPFALVICCSVLEHVRSPQLFAHNITRTLRQDGRIYLSIPWVWRYHAYPDDYWRFSWRGIEELFPLIEWQERVFSTTVPGEFIQAKPEADNALAMMIGGRKYLPYLMLNMIGRRR
jgi:SAM-dependent methyltransferase